MKKIKKLVACLSAAAISMTVGVSAFAATATYEDGFVKVADAPIDADHQWTVVVISADKADATLTAEDLYYINQGTNGESFWTNGMGTKTVLENGDYIVRIGGETITDPGQLIEIPFTVSSGSSGEVITLKYGDVNADESIGAADASLILQRATNIILNFTDAESKVVPDGVGDVNGDESVGAADASLVVQFGTGLIEQFVDSEGNPLDNFTYEIPAE